ncbi:MAG: ferritin family protein [Deltaproteobacteria bacterium]|nr:ferritin family protein [Deltaproteobacteria bacterium]
MKQLVDALKVALENEQRERAFYLEHAGRTKNPLGKAMFEQIADDELEHYERLKELHEKWKKEERWPDTVSLTVSRSKTRDLFARVVGKGGALPPGDDDDLKAIRIAIDFEAKGIEYYAGLRDRTPNEKEKAFFDLLSSMEREHYLSLKDTEEFLTDPVSWYRRTESPGLDGA